VAQPPLDAVEHPRCIWLQLRPSVAPSDELESCSGRCLPSAGQEELLLDHLRNDPGITVNDLADAMALCDGWRDIYAAAQRGWFTIENGRANPIGGYDLLCALPEATGDLVNSETLESVGGVTLPEAYRSHLTRARNLLAPS